MKKILIGIVTFVMMAVLCVVSAGAETYGDYEYTVLDDGTVEITDYTGSATELIIPSEIEGKSVTSIGYRAFAICENLVKVTISDSIINIADSAFIQCTSLTDITIPDSVERVGEYAFSGTALLNTQTVSVKYVDTWVIECDSNVESVVIKEGTKGIAPSAFSNCTALTSVTIPDGVVCIGDKAFFNCTNLAKINLPDSLKYIGYSALQSTMLKEVFIPDNVEEIGCPERCLFSTIEGTFASNDTLEAINVGENNKYYSSDNGVLYNKDKTILYFYPDAKKDKEYIIPESCKIISNYAFQPSNGGKGFTYLEKLSLPSNLERIEHSGLGGIVDELGTNVYLPETLTYIGYQAFDNSAAERIYIYSKNCKFPSNVGNSIYDAINTSPLTVLYLHKDSDTYYNFFKSINSSFSYLNYIENKNIHNDINWCYEIYKRDSVLTENELCVSGYQGDSTTATYPTKINGKEVDAYYLYSSNYKSITSVVLDGTHTKYESENGILYEINENREKIGVAIYPEGKKNEEFIFPDTFETASDCYNDYVKTVVIPKEIGEISETIGMIRYYASYVKIYGNIPDFVIKCYTDSAAHKYAVENNINYILLDADATSDVRCSFYVKSRNYNSITLNWGHKNSATQYYIQQYRNNEWVDIANINDNTVTSYQITGLTANTNYKFRVETYDTSTSSIYYTDTLTISTAPAMTTGFAITGRGSDFLTITWTKNVGASGYIIQEQVGGVWKNVASIKGNATTSYTVANLQPNSFHRYRMVAYKTDSNGTCYGKYTGSAPGYTAPAMVNGFKVSSIGADSLTVSWDKVESANGYVIDIYRDGKWSQLAKITSNATTSYKASGLTLGTTYKFRIKSYATNGTLTIYSTYSSAIAGVPTLSKVENLRMTNRGTDFISVRWDKNADADGYMVYIYDGTKWTCVKTLTTASSVSHKITGLESGKAYKVTVKAYKTVNGKKFISDTVTISANTL